MTTQEQALIKLTTLNPSIEIKNILIVMLSGSMEIKPKVNQAVNKPLLLWIEQRLNLMNVLEKSQVNGIWGTSTIEAVKKLQKLYGLKTDGIIGTETTKALIMGDRIWKDNQWFNPMPGGVCAGYVGDTGLDIAGDFLPVYAVADGTLDYAEHGHTKWVIPPDTGNSVRLKLITPVKHKKGLITHVWYTHLSKLEYNVKNGYPKIVVKRGIKLGVSGIGNGNKHLHIGFLLNNDTSQANPKNYLNESEIRELLF